MKVRYAGCYENDNGDAVLTLQVRHWFRWRTEHWARVKPEAESRRCGQCKLRAHDWWISLETAERLSCNDDVRLSALYELRIAMPSMRLPDNVVPLHRNGIYR